MVTIDEAQAQLAAIMPTLDELIAMRADLAEIQADLNSVGVSPHGGIADAKALEARLHGTLEEIAAKGIHLKGYAPLLLDFPGELNGIPVLWCWLEGDQAIGWYHRSDCGFAGRRRI